MNINSILMVAAVFIMLLAFMVPAIPTTGKIIITIAALCVIMFTRRGGYYFSKANKAMQSGDPAQIPGALENYKKAIKLGVSDQWVVTAASVLIQYGEFEEGIKFLEPVMAKKAKDPTNSINAKIAVSMGYWKTGRLDDAIAISEEVRSKGSKSKNLYVNLATYYLAKEDVKAFHELMKDVAKDEKLKSSALLDLQAVDAILVRHDYREAGEIIDELFDTYKFKFADPYLHRAQVQVYYGKRKEAIKSLEEGIDNSIFHSVSIITRELLADLIEILEDDEKAPYMESAMEKNALMLANGILPPLSDEPFVPKAEEKPAARIEAKQAEPDEERTEANTELTDEDEAWLRKHT